MGFSNNNMLCVYVLAAFLASGDCTLTPIVRPFLSLLNAPFSTLGNNGNPSISSYPYAVSSGRWGGGKMDAPVLVPNVATFDGVLSSKPPQYATGKVMKTHMMRPQMGVWTNKPLNKMGKMGGVPKINLKKGSTGQNMGWLVDGSEQIDIATKPVFVTPLKEGSKRMMLLQNDMDGDSGEDGGYLKDGSNELGSGEGSWKTSKLLAPTPMRGENLGQDMPKEDMERIVIIEKPISSWSHKSHNRLWHGYKMARNGKAACPNCAEANMA